MEQSKNKKVMLSIIGVAILVIGLVGITYAFFNYTRTGTSNTIRVGRISFNSSQDGNINLSNVFPIDSEQAQTDTTNAKSVSITITGDTDYTGGVEYLVTASDVNLSVGGKQLPIALEISVEGNNSKTLGTVETGDYYTNRENYQASKYKIEYNGELDERSHLLVGYIAPNTTSGTAEGVDGVINIKAYIDANKVLISDTHDGSESDNMGTPNSMAEGKTVFTTTEWNGIQGSPLSFKVKVEANEGIWVEAPLTFAQEIGRKMSTASYIASYDDIITQNPSFTTQDQVSTSATKQTVYYYTGDDAAANANVLFAGYSATGTFIFTVKEAGDYLINYNVSSEASYDKAKFYKNNTLIKEDSGTKEDSIELGTLTTTDEIKVEYTKDSISSSGNDNVIFEISKVINRVESENLQCQPNRSATKGINGANGSSTSLSGATLFGRSYDYDLATGEFILQDSTGLPTAWNDTNYKDLIGTYTCKSSSTTCTTLYYVGSYASSTSAYTASYTIGDVAHYSQLGTSAFNANNTPALVGYMYNTEYDYKSGSKSGEYFTTAVWENGAYTLSNGNGGSAPDATHHYICDSDCTKVRYYYYVSGSTYYYILLENGMTIEDAVYKMTGYGNATTLSKPINANYELNAYNSAVKGYLDNWYKKNLTAYASYLDSTSVYCNDRSIRALGGWNPSGTSLTGFLQFKQSSANRDLNCVNETDRFAVTNSKAELTYPIGLLTEPERNLMTANFAATGQYYWVASPSSFSSYDAIVRVVVTTGECVGSTVNASRGARVVISLKPGTKLEDGTGTYTNPYIVGPLVTRTN